MWSAIGELLFTVVVSYMGAIELFFVAKQLYHLAFQHQRRQMLISDEGSLKRLQDQIESEIIEAAGKEIHGFNAMKDGVLYKDGIRIDPGEINDHDKIQRQVIGSPKSDLDREDSESVKKNRELTTSESEQREEVCDEPCIRKHVEPITSGWQETEETTAADDKRTTLIQSVKTQIGQTNVGKYSPLVDVEETKELEKSSPSEPLTSPPLIPRQPSPLIPEMRFDEYQREEPDGQDVPEPQYSDEYLRSLDGIKIRPLVRDDGTGRRRAFKKRRSSDSTSSRESRASREEELKMFTSLEEEEFESIRRGDSDYVPIKYSSDPNLLKPGKHHRRHKKSPIKDTKHLEKEESRSSLEMLDEESSIPGVDVKPEHYKDTEFLQREKALSIEEENEENAPSWRDEDVQKQQAEQATASPSPTKNIPKLSSFEAASPSQHENAVSALSLEKSQEKEKKSVEKDDVKNVSKGTYSEPEQLIASSDHKSSTETEERFACIKSDEHIEITDVHKSPRTEDLCEQENALTPSAQSPKNNDSNNSQLTELQTEIAQAGTQTLTSTVNDTDNISSSLGEEYLRRNFPRTLDRRSKTPVIKVDSTSNDSPSCGKINDQIEETSEQGGLPEGISDFYDFNASINPSRSPSVERKSRSPSIHSQKSSKEPEKLSEKSETLLEETEISGLSDFYDFCVMMNQHAYGYQGKRYREAHTSSTDYLIAKLRNKKSRSKSPLPPTTASKNEGTSLQEEGGGTESLNSTPLDTPITPEYERSFSANMRYVERMKDEYRQNLFKRSRYVGESMDFENDFEYLRERTRHFKRSHSRSRSPIPEDGEPCTSTQAAVAARRELQERILEEITRTTINYQDFSHNINQKFIDYERRGSDSALLQKSELMIQLQDNLSGSGSLYDEEDIMNELEAEEYHHFRRFSLNQEQPVEEYPDDNDYIYLEQIEVQTKDGLRSWTRQDYYDREENSSSKTDEEASTLLTDITGEDSDHAEADDNDTESEDDRQTVVEVEDEIDEDVWDYERPEEYNEQSECEEAEREMDRYANKSAKDWSEDGAIGGVEQYLDQIESFKEDAINIDQMYNDAVKNIEESGIQKDYDIIVEEMNEEENRKIRNSSEFGDSVSVKTEDLLEEILREDERRYEHWSPRRDDVEGTRRFIDNETTFESSSQSAATSVAISSTRLRSRYGFGPSTVHRNFDNIDSVEVDLNYTPKKEYNWRKNFKLDDDDTPCVSNDSKIKGQTEPEVLSSGETLFPNGANKSQSPGRHEIIESETNSNFLSNEQYKESRKIDEKENNWDTFNIELQEGIETSKTSVPENESTTEKVQEIGEFEKGIGEKDVTPCCDEENEKGNKKKRTKRKTRKGSRGSVGGDEETLAFSEYGNNSNEILTEAGTKKKIKKKKKKAPESTSSSDRIKSPSPTGTDILYPTNPNKIEISKSLSPAKSPNLLTLDTSNSQDTSSALTETSKSPTHLTASPAATKSKSRSSEPVKSIGTSNEPGGTRTSPRHLERNDSTGVYDLIKDGSMYPWF